MSRIDELNQKLSDAEAAIVAEKAEGDAEKAKSDALAAEVATLKTQLENGLSADDAAAVEAKIDDLTAKIKDIVTPDAPAPEPTPEPTQEA